MWSKNLRIAKECKTENVATDFGGEVSTFRGGFR